MFIDWSFWAWIDFFWIDSFHPIYRYFIQLIIKMSDYPSEIVNMIVVYAADKQLNIETNIRTLRS